MVKSDVKCESSVLILFADCGRVIQVMKRDGVRGGGSSSGAVVPLGDGVGAPAGGADRMPERIAEPRVPGEITTQLERP